MEPLPCYVCGQTSTDYEFKYSQPVCAECLKEGDPEPCPYDEELNSGDEPVKICTCSKYDRYQCYLDV